MHKEKEVIWEGLRPNLDESKVGLAGMRSEFNGMRLECHLVNDVTNGLHATWEVGNENFKVSGIVKVGKRGTPQAAFAQAEQNAIAFAEFAERYFVPMLF